MAQDLPTLVEFLKAGSHFGHRVGKWHPKMAPYIYTSRNGVHIINIEKTRDMLAAALAFVRALAARGGKIIFVGTKRQASLVIRREAERAGMPFVDTRWLGGTITNFEVIARVIEKYLSLQSQDAKGELGKYTKKEQVEIHRDIARMEGMVGGIQTLKSVPDALFVVDVKHERTAVREALAKKIPIVAISDTNTNPTGIAYPIPANDDALKSIEMITKLVADAVLEGQTEAKEEAASKSVEVKETT